VIRGNQQLWTLLHLKYTKHIKAGDGQPGGGQLKSGADGEDKVLEVPLGTVAKSVESEELLCEVTADGQEHVILKGGRGGLGNDHFKSATNQAPKYAQPGEPGLEEWIILELKLLADVGLVGFPNAGKSTLLSVISAAKPEIADYPFTTLVPNLGMVKYRGYNSFVVADIPGIIQGASKGKGLGLRFLRHIERNALLLFMVPADSNSIIDEYRVLLNELSEYNPELLDKTRMLAITKADLLDDELKAEITKELPPVKHIFISSVSGEGIQKLKDLVWEELNNLKF
jgi:GTP-binding protein